MKCDKLILLIGLHLCLQSHLSAGTRLWPKVKRIFKGNSEDTENGDRRDDANAYQRYQHHFDRIVDYLAAQYRKQILRRPGMGDSPFNPEDHLLHLQPGSPFDSVAMIPPWVLYDDGNSVSMGPNMDNNNFLVVPPPRPYPPPQSAILNGDTFTPIPLKEINNNHNNNRNTDREEVKMDKVDSNTPNQEKGHVRAPYEMGPVADTFHPHDAVMPPRWSKPEVKTPPSVTYDDDPTNQVDKPIQRVVVSSGYKLRGDDSPDQPEAIHYNSNSRMPSASNEHKTEIVTGRTYNSDLIHYTTSTPSDTYALNRNHEYPTLRSTYTSRPPAQTKSKFKYVVAGLGAAIALLCLAASLTLALLWRRRRKRRARREREREVASSFQEAHCPNFFYGSPVPQGTWLSATQPAERSFHYLAGRRINLNHAYDINS